MPRRSFAVVLAIVATVAACIDVPDSMRAQFAPAGPGDKTNYRPGNHGVALPLVEVPDASAPVDASDVDAAAPIAPADGGSV